MEAFLDVSVALRRLPGTSEIETGRVRSVGNRVQLAIGAFHVSPIEHPTFEDYLASKLRIFENARVAVVNAAFDPARKGHVEAGEIGVPAENGLVLPCGASARMTF